MKKSILDIYSDLYPSKLTTNKIIEHSINGYGVVVRYDLEFQILVRQCELCEFNALTYDYNGQLKNRTCHHQWRESLLQIGYSRDKTLENCQSYLHDMILEFTNKLNDKKIKHNILSKLCD